ncbi:MAG: hypothetical protein RXR09_05815 [Acidilobus sp.]
MSEQQRPQEQQQQAAQGPEELTEVARMLRDAAAQLRSIIDSLNNPLAAIAVSAMQPQPQARQESPSRAQAGVAGRAEAQRPLTEEQPSEVAGVAGRAEAQRPLTEEQPSEVKAAAPLTVAPLLQIGEPKQAASQGVSVEKVMKLLGLFADMSMLSSDFFENVVKAMGSLGVLSEGERDALVYLLNTMKLGIDKGLSPQEVISLLAILFSEAGVSNDDVIRGGLAKMILSKLRRQEESR